MAEEFDAVQQDAEARKRAILAAQAQYGSQGVTELRALEDANRTSQQAGVHAALAAATQRGAPGTAQADLAKIVGAPGDMYARDMAASRQSWQNLMGASTQAHTQYMDQAKAGVPLVEAKLKQLAAMRAAEEARRRAEEGGATADIIKALGGRESVKNLFLTGAQDFKAGASKGGAGGLTDAIGTIVGRGVPAEYFAKEGAKNAGLDPLVADGLYKVPAVTPQKIDVRAAAVAAGIKDSQLNSILTNTSTYVNGDEGSPYQDALDSAEDAVKSGLSYTQFQSALEKGFMSAYGHDFPLLRRLIGRMYDPLFSGR